MWRYPKASAQNANVAPAVQDVIAADPESVLFDDIPGGGVAF